MGWGTGLELGDKKKFVRLGAAYFEIEADAVPVALFDSDLFDGPTNGKGWMFHGTRQIWKNTDFSVTVYVGEPLDNDVAAIQRSSLPGGLGLVVQDRVRANWDINIRY
jgi:hypothetical protein